MLKIRKSNKNYVRTMSGLRLSKTLTRTYCGNFIYEDGNLSQVLFDGGYITFNGSDAEHHYYIQDHLGNNRIVAKTRGIPEQTNHYYPFGSLMGTSTDGDTQRYKYNGKELDRMNGLDLYDYGARFYDGIRFTTMDPLAEKYYSVSPYAYCANNPVRFIDPDGRDVYLFATTLPNTSDNWYNPLSYATHTFLVVINNDKIDYYAYGPKDDDVISTISGTSQLTRVSYQQDIEIINSSLRGESPKELKNKELVAVPEGLSQEQFDSRVKSVADSFGNNPWISYSLFPGDDPSLGNCNTSSSTILHKAGVNDYEMRRMEKNIPGINTGFNNYKPWTRGEQKQVEINTKARLYTTNTD